MDSLLRSVRIGSEALFNPPFGSCAAAWFSGERRSIRYDAAMPYYGKLIGTNHGIGGTWLLELDDDGVPVDGFTLIPVETMPDVVPVWTLDLPIGVRDGVRFSPIEAGEIAILMMRRRMAELRGRDIGS